jgi:hypothetical protein
MLTRYASQNRCKRVWPICVRFRRPDQENVGRVVLRLLQRQGGLYCTLLENDQDTLNKVERALVQAHFQRVTMHLRSHRENIRRASCLFICCYEL